MTNNRFNNRLVNLSIKVEKIYKTLENIAIKDVDKSKKGIRLKQRLFRIADYLACFMEGCEEIIDNNALNDDYEEK